MKQQLFCNGTVTYLINDIQYNRLNTTRILKYPPFRKLLKLLCNDDRIHFGINYFLIKDIELPEKDGISYLEKTLINLSKVKKFRLPSGKKEEIDIAKLCYFNNFEFFILFIDLIKILNLKPNNIVTNYLCYYKKYFTSDDTKDFNIKQYQLLSYVIWREIYYKEDKFNKRLVHQLSGFIIGLTPDEINKVLERFDFYTKEFKDELFSKYVIHFLKGKH